MFLDRIPQPDHNTFPVLGERREGSTTQSEQPRVCGRVLVFDGCRFKMKKTLNRAAELEFSFFKYCIRAQRDLDGDFPPNTAKKAHKGERRDGAHDDSFPQKVTHICQEVLFFLHLMALVWSV